MHGRKNQPTHHDTGAATGLRREDENPRRRRTHAGEETVTELELSRCGLVALPPEIGQLTALVKLELPFNSLTALTMLNLSQNRLRALPPGD
jgi:Leucine-rich repeat (LRR) protein